MAVRTTIQMGHPALQAANALIESFSHKKTQQVVKDLIDTMRAEDLIGMAAPQIAENYTIFVTEPRETRTRSKDQSDELRVYINPKIVNTSDETCCIYEGCGSVIRGELFGPVIRPRTVIIEAFNQYGKKFRFHADGILARVIQHEYDHLQGIEFIEKISDYARIVTRAYYIQDIKNQAWHINASKITDTHYEEIG